MNALVMALGTLASVVLTLLLVVFIIGVFGSYGFPTDGTWQGRATNFRKFLQMLFTPNRVPASVLYELWGQHIYTVRTRYLNLGYWPEASDLDEAGEALAHLLGEAADLPDQRLLDVGFGFAEQDFYWWRTFSPAEIVGINITDAQVEFASQRAQDEGLADKLSFAFGSATSMPFEAEAFDRVTALECAFHFDSREAFLGEAHRVLRPGGRVALADVIPTGQSGNLVQAALEPIRRALWQIPKCNQYAATVYAEKLEAAGFTEVEIRSIASEVYLPLRQFVKAWAARPENAGATHWLHRNPFSQWLTRGFLTHGPPFAPMDYVLVTAVKASIG